MYVLTGLSMQVENVVLSVERNEHSRRARIVMTGTPKSDYEREAVKIAAVLLSCRVARYLPGWVVDNPFDTEQPKQTAPPRVVPRKRAGPSIELQKSWSGV